MEHPASLDEDLIRRLPLPLAQQYRRAHNGKTALERHLAAYYLWEASLKLLASVAVVEFATLNDQDPELLQRLRALARPTVGHWWEFVRRLTPVLADARDPPFSVLRDFLLGRSRDDLPRAAGLDAALREVLDGQAAPRATVRPMELYDRLVRYRNREVGHGAAGQRPNSHYEWLGRALTLGIAEILARLDALAGRRLLYVPDVRRQASGAWLVERQELIGETARRIESLEVPEAQANLLPRPETLYVVLPQAGEDPQQQLSRMRSLHPLLSYNSDTNEIFFLNGRQGRQRAEYLSYSSGNVIRRDSLLIEQQDLLSRILGGVVDSAALEQWADRSVAEEHPSQPPEVPKSQRTLGEFELLSRIGRGGMGVVYRAWQPSLGRQVAIKSLLRSGDPKAEARFAREIRALGRVEHPHLVKIFTSGALGDQWFYAMELIEGADLASVYDVLVGNPAAEIGAGQWQHAVSTAWQHARSKEETLSSAEESARSLAPEPPQNSSPLSQTSPRRDRSHVRHIVEIVWQVANAAHALHEEGIIHRDIKPGNIMLAPDGEHAVLMDLGLAQLADDAEGRLTRTRQFIGTLRYASPEQVLAVGQLDRRTDVYSLGATLWELLTLKPLFGATEAMPTPELMLKIQSTDPQRPSQLNPRIPADLDAIVGKCLEKDRDRRYASAAELLADLERFLAGDPVSARPIGQLDRAWRFLKRNPRVAVLSAAVLLLSVTLAAISTVAAFSLAAARKDVEQQLRESLYQQARSAWLAHCMGWRAEALEAIARAARIDRSPALRDIAVQAIFDTDLGLEGELSVPAVITAAAFAASGEQAAFAQDGTVHVWNRQHDRWESEPARLFGRGQRITQLRYSDDGRRILGGTQAGEVFVWDLSRNRSILNIVAHTLAVQDVVFGPTEATIASTDGKQLVIIDRDSGQKLDHADLTLFSTPAMLAPSADVDPCRIPAGLSDEAIVANAPTVAPPPPEGPADAPAPVEAGGAAGPDEESPPATVLAANTRRSLVVVLAAGGSPVLFKLTENKLEEPKHLGFYAGGGAPRMALTNDGQYLIVAQNEPPYLDAPVAVPSAPMADPAASTPRPEQRSGMPEKVHPARFQPSAVETPTPVQPQVAESAPAASTVPYTSPFGGGLDLGSLSSLSDAARSPSGDLSMYNLDDNTFVASVTVPRMGMIESIAAFGSGNDFLVAGSSGSIAQLRAGVGLLDVAHRWEAVPQSLTAALPSRDEVKLLTVDSSRRLRVSVKQGYATHGSLRTQTEYNLWQLRTSADRSCAWMADSRNGVWKFDLRTPGLTSLYDHPGIKHFDSAHDGRTMVFLDSGKPNQLVAIGEIMHGNEGEDKTQPIPLRGHPDKMDGRGVTLSNDGLWLALGGEEGVSHLWKRELDEFVYVRPFGRDDTPVWALEFSPESDLLIAAYLDRSLMMWNTNDGSLVGKARLDDHPVGCFALNPDCRLIACGSMGGSIMLRSASDLSLVQTLEPKAEMWGVAFSSDALMLAAGDRDGGISLYDVGSGQRCARWSGHRAPVTELAFDDRDGKLITCDNTGTIRSWDLRELQARLKELDLAW